MKWTGLADEHFGAYSEHVLGLVFGKMSGAGVISYKTAAVG